MTTTCAAAPIVYIVDDDRRVREAMAELFASFDLESVAFASAGEYLAFPKPDVPSCMLLDVELPDINGLDLQSLMAETDHPHIVFVTGRGDIPSSVRAIKTGAVDFLVKPVVTEHLMRAVEAALTQNREMRKARTQLRALRDRLSRLTPRELEVLPLVVGGFLNKQAAAALGISEVTLQIHRSKIMQKMEAGSLAELVRMAGLLEIPIAAPPHAGR